jgi:hypothetical protein
VIGSYSTGGADETLCTSFYGMSPMPFFTTQCPHCEYVDFLAGFSECDDDPEELWLRGAQECANYELIAERLIKEGHPPDRIGIIYHQAGCCLKRIGGNPKKQFKLAVKYLGLAQKNGIDKIDKMSISEIIQRLSRS